MRHIYFNTLLSELYDRDLGKWKYHSDQPQTRDEQTTRLINDILLATKKHIDVCLPYKYLIGSIGENTEVIDLLIIRLFSSKNFGPSPIDMCELLSNYLFDNEYNSEGLPRIVQDILILGYDKQRFMEYFQWQDCMMNNNEKTGSETLDLPF